MWSDNIKEVELAQARANVTLYHAHGRVHAYGSASDHFCLERNLPQPSVTRHHEIECDVVHAVA